jgi:DNA-binding transcriptional MerR regulator
MTVPTAPAEPMIRIGHVARSAGVSVRAVRYYEQQGLLDADRTPSGQRLYRPAAIERVRLVRQMYAAGLTSRTIAALLPPVESHHADPGQLALARVERDRIRSRIEDLRIVGARLDRVISSAHTRA